MAGLRRDPGLCLEAAILKPPNEFFEIALERFGELGVSAAHCNFDGRAALAQLHVDALGAFALEAERKFAGG